jgi:hypothetical protein
MHRVYFDENAGDARGRFDLGIPGSRRDLETLAGELRNGAHVLLYDGQEIAVEAILEFDQASDRWMAMPLWTTIRRRGDARADDMKAILARVPDVPPMPGDEIEPQHGRVPGLVPK